MKRQTKKPTKNLTKEQVNNLYKGKYIKIIQSYDYDKKQTIYEVVRVHNKRHENTTLGENVGTDMEYWD